MENTYLITTDSTTDFDPAYIKEHDIHMVPLSYVVDGVSHPDLNATETGDYKAFYDALRAGAMPTTSQVTPEEGIRFFEPLLQQGYDILHLAFTSGLSGTCGSMMVAADELREKYPERKITVIDSLCASLGEGLLYHHMRRLQDEGKSMEEVAKWTERNKLRLCHQVIADDLHHLQRGGRVSKTAAVFGTMLGIKPIIHVNNEGKLIPVGKARGRKAGIESLLKTMEEKFVKEDNDVVYICHADCLEDAQQTAKQIKQRFGVKEVYINYIGTVIGSHTGCGTMAIFFLGDKRDM
ncbi:DegV family protein [bacterium 210820-DFI.6.52]|nr:DegV family protein [bacterium 210820-DFI.6.52]